MNKYVDINVIFYALFSLSMTNIFILGIKWVSVVFEHTQIFNKKKIDLEKMYVEKRGEEREK